MTAAVIGGGIAGLTAAYELVKAGERPFLIEPGPIGGMVRSGTVSGFTLEYGPNVLVERPDLKDLLSDLHLTADVAYPTVEPYGQYVWYNDRAVKVPTGFLELLKSPLFTAWTKLTLPCKALLPGILPAKQPDYSVYDFFSPLLGGHTVRHLLDPVLKGIYGGEVSTLSARSVFPNLWNAATAGRSIFGYMRSRRGNGKPRILVVKGGIQRIAEALWHHVGPRVEHISSRAQRIMPLEGGRYRISLEGGRQIEADGCVVTAAGRQVAPLLGYLSEELADHLTNSKYATLAVVHLRVSRNAPLIHNAFGVLFPGGMPQHLLGVMFNSQIFPHVAPAAEHILTVVLGGAQAGEQLFDEVVLREKIPQLLQQLIGIDEPKWLSMTQWPAAVPQLEVGHYKLVELLDECEHAFPGIVFTGLDRGGVGVSDRIRLAREAIKRFRRVRVETVV
ncbi:MAG: protoporphyrinogen oxidase [Pseudomonadota bacterium]|jgi:oxygen-dependent protoporphyrinogen oxidase